MWRIYGGAIMLIGGIATFIEIHTRRPVTALVRGPTLQDAIRWEALEQAGVTPHAASGLSPTAYDVLRIGAWTLVILGALTIVVGLIRYWVAIRVERVGGLEDAR